MNNRVLFSVCVLFVLVILVACGGGDSAETDAPIETPPGAIAINTPIPTPDPTEGFVEYASANGYFTALYPAHWATSDQARFAEEQLDSFFIMSEAGAFNGPQPDAPFAFVNGAVVPIAAFRNAQLIHLQEEFLIQFMGMFATPESDWRVAEQDGFETVSRDYYISPSGMTPEPLLITMQTTMREENVFVVATGTSADFPDSEDRATADLIYSTVKVISSAESLTDDETDPATVLEQVFAAARMEDFGRLADLCDPQGENDGDTETICAITDDHPEQATFVSQFATGGIIGEARVEGDSAEIDFRFGPNGEWEETMTLINRDGQWYLLDF
jgi:hypothetical protein